jgi:LysR family transcriptional regulator, nitrogen assimilation regulatory protein
MDIEQLQCFVAVADNGSFSRAAVMLRVPQPRLSRAIRALEVELRQNLFHRHGRGVSLTDPGRKYLAHCRGILVQLERARGELEQARGEPSGRAVVGLPHSIARVLTVPMATSFRAQFPQAMLRVTEGLTLHLQEWLLAGRIDIALLHDPVPTAAIETVPLRRDRLYLMGPESSATGSEVPMRELAKLPLVMPGRPHPMRMFVETQLSNLGLKPQIVVEIDSIGAIVDAVEGGLGYAIVSANAMRARAHEPQLARRPIVEPELSSALVLAYSAERPMTLLMQQTITLLEALLRKLLPGGEWAVRDSSAA